MKNRLLAPCLAGALALLLGACDDDGVSPRRPDRLLVAPERMRLYAGEQSAVAAQVLDRAGGVIPGARVTFRSEDAAVAEVDDFGMVTGVAPGDTRVSARFGLRLAWVDVAVLPDDRAALRTLELLAAEVSADARNPEPVLLPFVAMDGFGRSLCGTVAITLRTDPAVATAEDRSTGPADCMLRITPRGVGETWLVASAGGHADSARVRVTADGYVVAFTEEPPADSHVAGATVTYGVRVVDQADRPVAGHPVSFVASRGGLAAPGARTDASGIARVSWTLPERIADAGLTQVIAFRTILPGGALETGTRDARLRVGAPASLRLYTGVVGRYSHWTTELFGDTVGFPSWRSWIIAASFDRFGNITTSNIVMSSQRSGLLSGGMSCQPDGYLYWTALRYDYAFCHGSVPGGTPYIGPVITISIPGTPLVRWVGVGT